MLRALVFELPELQVRPQVEVVARHAHSRDRVRHTALTVEGWLVLRFTWEQVILSPAHVRSVLADLVISQGSLDHP